MVFAVVISPDEQREIGLQLCSGGKDDYVWKGGDLLGQLFL